MRRPVALAIAAVAAGSIVGASLVAVPASAASESLFSGVTPTNPSDSDRAAVTLGTAVTARAAGQVTGLRFYKGAANSGTHVGAVFTADGSMSVRAPFTNETSSGWQTVSLPSPVYVASGTKFVAAVLMPNGHYAVTNPYAFPVSSASLTATSGVYAYGSGVRFPTSTYQKSNYLIDVVYAADGSSSLPSSSPSPSVSVTPSASPTAAPTLSPTASPTASPSPTSTSTASAPLTAWPDASNTGVAGCPPLTKIYNGNEVKVDQPGQIYENVELMNEGVIRVLAPNVTVRCVKMNGTGYHGIQNMERTTATNVTVDRVDISCKQLTQRIGMLLRDATVTRANVHDCDHMINAGGDNLTIRDSYCHGLTQAPVVHADCIQSLGGNTGLTIDHNSLWGWGTSDILLGQEYGEVKNAVITRNRLMSDPNQTPPPAYLLYLTGTNTVVKDNRFTRRYTYGRCTHNNQLPFTWTGNVWDDDGSPIPTC